MKESRRVVLASAALLLTLIGCATHGKTHDDKDVKVTLADVPQTVRSTLERESAGGKVTEVERETKGGKIVYSADLVVGGKAWDITVAEDGSVLSKEEEKESEKDD